MYYSEDGSDGVLNSNNYDEDLIIVGELLYWDEMKEEYVHAHSLFVDHQLYVDIYNWLIGCV